MPIERFEIDTEQWAVVPRVPTQDMQKAGFIANNKVQGCSDPDEPCIYCGDGFSAQAGCGHAALAAYKAMITVAPHPEQAQIKETGPWTTGSDNGRCFVESGDFTHDVRLYIDGDFSDFGQKCAYAAAIAKRLNAQQPEQVQQSASFPCAILPEEMEAFARFCECCEYDDSYDVPKDMMNRLAEIGLVRSLSRGAYQTTEFGISVAAQQPAPRQVFSKEWCMKMAELEGDANISIGFPPAPRPIPTSERLPTEAAFEWQPIESAPKGRIVLVHYYNVLGKSRTVRAAYYLADSLESEDTESGFADEGWYEEAEAYDNLAPVDGEPTHWMPLPPPPKEPSDERA